MDADRWSRLKALFHAALAITPEGRAPFLAEACSSDVAPGELRAEVERLLEVLADDGVEYRRARVARRVVGERHAVWRAGRVPGPSCTAGVWRCALELRGRAVAAHT